MRLVISDFHPLSGYRSHQYTRLISIQTIITYIDSSCITIIERETVIIVFNSVCENK